MSTVGQVREHRLDSIYKREIVAYLDKLHADGFVTLSIEVSGDIQGYDVISYKEQWRGRENIEYISSPLK
jgi:hypothetical protein